MPLSDRRNLAKLSTMYEIHNNLVPDYLKNIFPSTRSLESNYKTRNREDYTIPKCRLEIFKKSFVPDTINKWNSLSLVTGNNSSFTSFKSSIQLNQTNPPSYFCFGKRRFNIIQTKLRHNGILNFDLFRRNIESPNCQCGLPEDSYYLFFGCKKYKCTKRTVFKPLINLNQINIINCQLLLWGDESLTVNLNRRVFFLAVQRFIRDCGRFS